MLVPEDDEEEENAMTNKSPLKPSRTSISAFLSRRGFGRNARILRGTVVLAGFKVSDGVTDGSVSVTWGPGSDWDDLDTDTWYVRVREETVSMVDAYAGELLDKGYRVEISATGLSLNVWA